MKIRANSYFVVAICLSAFALGFTWLAVSNPGVASGNTYPDSFREGIWGNFEPSGWISDTRVACSVVVSLPHSTELDASFQVSIDSGYSWSTWIEAHVISDDPEIILETSAIEFPEGERNRVRFRLNEAESPPFIVLIDRTPPMVTVDVPPFALTGSSPISLTVSWSAEDEGSGLHEDNAFAVDFRQSGGPWISWLVRPATVTKTIFGPTDPVTVTIGAEYGFRVKARDRVNQIGESMVVTSQIRPFLIHLPVARYHPTNTATPSPTSTLTPTPTPTPTSTPVPSWQSLAFKGESTYAIGESQDDNRRLFIATEYQGVFHNSACGSGVWSPVNLPAKFALSVLAVNDFELVGTFGDGLYRRESGGEWRPVSLGDPNVWDLLYANDHAYAATDSGVFKGDSTGLNWQPWRNGLSGGALLVNDIWQDHNGDLWIGTFGAGVYRSANGENNWTPERNGLTNDSAKVWRLTQSDSMLFAATSDGVFGRDISSGFWRREGLGGLIVYAITLSSADSTLYAGTRDNGAYYRIAGSGDWRTANNGWSGTTRVRDLLASSECNQLFAATSDGVWSLPLPVSLSER